MTRRRAVRRLVVLGASGFIGSAVAARAKAGGALVLGIDRPGRPRGSGADGWAVGDLLTMDLRRALKGFRPDAVVHAAGSASVAGSLAAPWADFEQNVVTTHRVLDALRAVALRCRFLLLSSAAVYGSPPRLPVGEDAPIRPLSPYGYHKRQAELGVEAAHVVHGMATASVRVFSAYGAGLRKQVVWDLCEKTRRRGKIRLQGTGRESRDFVHVEDVADAVLRVLECGPLRGECYNVASGRETRIGGLAHQVLRCLGDERLPEFDGVVPPGVPTRWRADLTRIRRLGFSPRVPLEAGLERTAAWWKGR